MKTIIPRIMHFIWIGNDFPRFAANAIDQFKRANSSFDINLVKCSNSYKTNDINTQKIIDKTINEIRTMTGNYVNAIDYYMNTLHRSEKQTLSNILRLELLNTYGGIYLDCDCFPIKPFDDEIMNRSFTVMKSNGGKPFKDCFFMGHDKSFMLTSYFNIQNVIQYNISKLVMLNSKRDFINGKLNYQSNLNSYDYIIHYNLQTWKV